jgi:hypothetical protein
MRPSLLALLAVLSCAVTVASACGSAALHDSSSSGGSTSTTTTTTVGVVTVGVGGTGGVGSVGGTGVGGDGGQVSNVYPAPFPAPPQVADLGGPVLTAPHVVPVFFADDDAMNEAQIIDFLGKVGATSYWSAVTSEYGVGPLTADVAVVLVETAPATIDDNGVETWLADKLDSGDPAFPPPDDNAIYAIHYPATTTITLDAGQGEVDTSCVNFGGYHSNITLTEGNASVAYAVIPTCPNFDGFSGIDAITAAESHELVEASTDPFPAVTPAYAEVDQAHFYWIASTGGVGEVGDMCAENLASFTKFPELAYVVQRTWSNAAARAGQDPCVPPLAGEVYFNSVPEMSDMVDYTFDGLPVSVVGVKVPVGTAREIDLDLFSGAATPGAWSVSVQEMGSHNLQFQLGDPYGQNGQKVHLTITPLGAGPSVFTVSSLPTWSAEPTTWVGFVNN